MPRITDKAGRELKIGSRVERAFNDGSTGNMRGIVTWAARRVDVTFIPVRVGTFGTERSGFRCRRCLDLIRIDNHNGKEKNPGA